MFKSRLWLKVFAYTFLIVATCSLAITLYSAPMIRKIIYQMEEKYALAQLDRVYDLVQAKYQEIKDYRESSVEARKRELRNITEVFGRYMLSEYNAARNGLITEEEAQKKVLNDTRTILYGNNDYIWISDFHSVLISHPDPKLHGADFSQTRDVHGNLIVPPMVDVARQSGSGFTSYWWNRLGYSKPSEKLTYSKLFPPWHWVYGTGVYLDDIEEEVAWKKEKLIRELRAMMKHITVGRTGYMYIFDDRKSMVIHPNTQLQGADVSDLKNPLTGNSIFDELIEASGKKRPELSYLWDRPTEPGNYVYDKKSWVRHFPGFNWYIASSAYTDELHEVSRMMTQRIISISILVFIASLVLGYIFLKRLLSPIEQLSRVALEVQKGNLDVRSGIQGEDEIGILAREFDNMVDKLQDHLETLDTKVREKTQELKENYEKLEYTNAQLMDSMEYARIIQRAILPGEEELATHLGDYFVIWHPKDMLGGDVYWFKADRSGFLLAVIDCTGHGVPGAVMTMIAATTLSRVVHEMGQGDPAGILMQLNRLVRSSLNQHLDKTKTDDGMDIGLCRVDHRLNRFMFAGARIDLYHSQNGSLKETRGDRQSLGYKSSDPDYRYTNHEYPLEEHTTIYMTTDGLTDQAGGVQRFPFGKTRLKAFLEQHHSAALNEQAQSLEDLWGQFKGDASQRDDVTIIGFRPSPSKEVNSNDR